MHISPLFITLSSDSFIIIFHSSKAEKLLKFTIKSSCNIVAWAFHVNKLAYYKCLRRRINWHKLMKRVSQVTMMKRFFYSRFWWLSSYFIVKWELSEDVYLCLSRSKAKSNEIHHANGKEPWNTRRLLNITALHKLCDSQLEQ